MNKLQNKRRHLQNSDSSKNDIMYRKRMRVILGFLLVMIAFVLLGAIFISTRIFLASTLYHAFIYDWIGTAFLYLSGLTVLLFFIYCCLVITIKNPQKIKGNKVFGFGVTGIICLAIASYIFYDFGSLTINSVSDMRDYSNGLTKTEVLEVVDAYTGGNIAITLIDTEDKELTRLLPGFRIEEGETYRITYLERTGTILHIEKN
ncbi:hypothetical protein [Niallia taxi]|uniref:hypothetical protein n=1 Tax=Niallia taxi TaxID=2499688 RepID=UPI003D2C217C